MGNLQNKSSTSSIDVSKDVDREINVLHPAEAVDHHAPEKHQYYAPDDPSDHERSTARRSTSSIPGRRSADHSDHTSRLKSGGRHLLREIGNAGDMSDESQVKSGRMIKAEPLTLQRSMSVGSPREISGDDLKLERFKVRIIDVDGSSDTKQGGQDGKGGSSK